MEPKDKLECFTTNVRGHKCFALCSNVNFHLINPLLLSPRPTGSKWRLP